MKTKIDYAFKGIGLDFIVPMDAKQTMKGTVTVKGDIDLHVETTGTWFDMLINYLMFGRLIKELKQLIKQA